MKPASFILVEDHTLFRNSVAEALEDSGRYQCVGSFSTMEEALDNITDGLQTHLVLLDLGLPQSPRRSAAVSWSGSDGHPAHVTQTRHMTNSEARVHTESSHWTLNKANKHESPTIGSVIG